MRPRCQCTLRRPVSIDGVGYWSGREVRVELLPAPAGSGVVFVRGDRDVPVRIGAAIDNRVEAVQRTVLAVAGVQVQMVEHVMSALAGLGVDCCQVRVSAEELPGLDGSAQAFVDLIDAAGLEQLGAPVEPLVVEEAFRVGDGDSWVEVSQPRRPGLSVEYELDYGPGPIGRQVLTLEVTPDAYRTDLAAARTFISAGEAERLRAAGLGLASTHRDLLVFGADGPIGNSLRWPDECVRHKVLDLVGDLALVGRPLHAHVRARRSGHRLNGAAAARLVAASRRRASA
ncbi:MAG: UDP-3-O-acyl-N-acetylglucosamine deacetylase [Planctomycetaceae bacterium]